MHALDLKILKTSPIVCDTIGLMNGSRNTKKNGDTSAVIILAKLIRDGYSVSLPWGDNQRYDMIVDTGWRLLRIQCKTAWTDGGKIRACTSNTSTLNGKLVRYDYSGQVEFFFFYWPDEDKILCLPIEEATASEVSFRIVPPKNGQKTKVRMIDDYLFDGFDDAVTVLPFPARPAKKIPSRACDRCGDKVLTKGARCRKCSGELRRKIQWPSDAYLLEEISASSVLAVARKLGVSDNSVRKHLKLS